MILKNAIKITLRKLKSQPLFSLLKTGCLGISVGSVVLMMLYVDFQWQYDRFHKKGHRIYRIRTDQYKDGELVAKSAMTYAGIGPLMQSTFSEVENQVRLGKWIANDIVFQYKDNAARVQNLFFTEPSFFRLFSINLTRGDPKTALVEPNSVVLTEKMAKRLFGETDPMGHELKFESRRLMKVTGIIKEVPFQSHLQFGALASYSTWQGTGMAGEGVYGDNHFQNFYTYTYVLLYPEAEANQVGERLTALVPDHKKGGAVRDVFTLQPLKNIHLYSDLQYEMKASGGGGKIWTLLTISILILVLAWANYINISTATAFDQSKAIAIRKVAGASQLQIAGQLLTENLIYTFMALLTGLVMASSLVPSVENLFEIRLSGSAIFKNGLFRPFSTVFALISVGTLIISFLPAILISSFQPIQTLRKAFIISGFSINIRKALVVFQFTIIIGLLAASIIILKQTHYIQRKDPGIDLSGILIVKGPLGTSIYENVNIGHVKFHNTLTTMSSVSNIASSHKVPGQDLEIVNEVRLGGTDGFFSFNRVYVTPSFFEVYKIPFLVGEAPAMTNVKYKAVIINEAAMHQLGFQDPYQVLGKQLIFWESEYLITGVIRNYYHLSLHQPVTPTMFDLIGDKGLEDGYFSIKMNQRDYHPGIDKIHEAFKSTYPHTVFEYFDLGDYYYDQYKADIDFRTLNLVFTVLAFLIACLGLFALSVILMKKRMKEVGIRKILGSSVPGIVILLSTDFMGLVLFGWIAAIPITWYVTALWLRNFAYRITIEWWVFIVAGGFAAGLAALVVSFNAFKAAASNPVDILRGE